MMVVGLAIAIAMQLGLFVILTSMFCALST
jgi:hypothetical protein